MSHFEHKFQTEGGVAHKPLLVSERKLVIALSCGIKISAVHCLVLSQGTRVTDRQTDGRTDRQNYDSQDRASIAAPRGKKEVAIANGTARSRFNGKLNFTEISQLLNSLFFTRVVYWRLCCSRLVRCVVVSHLCRAVNEAGFSEYR